MRHAIASIVVFVFGAGLWAQNPNTAVFPAAAATDTNLLVANNNVTTTLASPINASTTTVPLASALANLPMPVSIDNEILNCTALVSGTTYTCSRAFNGTTAASHAFRAIVKGNFISYQLNQTNAEVKAIESALISGFRYDSGFVSASAACGSSVTVAVTTQSIWQSLATMTCNAQLWFPTGAGVAITPASGQAITLAHCPVAGISTIINLTAGGVVLLPAGCDYVPPQWWGAAGNLTADDTAAFQAWADYVSAKNGTHIGNSGYCPGGTYKITSPIVFSSSQGMRITGSNGCEIEPSGTASTSAVWDFVGDAQALIENIRFVGSAANAWEEAIRLEQQMGAFSISSHDVFHNVTIEGSNGGFVFGVRGLNSSAAGGNNDLMTFESLEVRNVTGCEVSIEGQQVKNWTFYNSVFYGNGTSQAAICGGISGGNAQLVPTIVTVHSGFVSGHTKADFKIGAPPGIGEATLIEGVRSEGSNRFFDEPTDGASGVSQPVTFIGDSFSDTAATAADGKIIELPFDGPYVMVNCHWGENYLIPTIIDWRGGGITYPQQFVMIASRVNGTNTSQAQIFPHLMPQILSSWATTAASASFRLFSADRLINSVSFSSTPVFDLSLGDVTLTLTGNVTSSTFSNGIAGEVRTFQICQDGSGNHTFAWPASFHGAVTIGSTASKCSVQEFETFDGSNFYAIAIGVINQ